MMDRLLSMEVFVAVVDLGSLSAAAERFALSAPMVSKHVRHLEQRLGGRLFNRTTRQQSLTAMGQNYYQRCLLILQDIRAAEASAAEQQEEPRGRVRINAPVTFGSLALTPVLTGYLQRYPQVSIELDLNDQQLDMTAVGADLTVRIGRLADSSLIARSLRPYQMQIAASPAYLTRHGEPLTPADLSQHQCLGFNFWRKGRGWQLGGQAQEEIRSRLRSNQGQALKTAALAGFGIVMQPAILLQDAIDGGQLQPLLQDYVPAPRQISLLYHQDRQRQPTLATLIDWIVKALAD
ncbi:LysR family transcriptional regulator [Pokkaliibacter sp. MBI-7]|uniref:LysR family transcriptional regulator n=1 Tax=Pokkaliibacter sp. MBI-7 TaxID=3040600 RepID=UPI002448F6E8|nr:LysR family transcriptional regulator [Pokkaliibacter sp. MBI-7]MDH2432647.1 LysR family transcriptional regulator [Pokkaliibacter sp. MBI-7]